MYEAHFVPFSFDYAFVLEEVELAMIFMLSKTKEIFQTLLLFVVLMGRLWNGGFYVNPDIRYGR